MQIVRSRMPAQPHERLPTSAKGPVLSTIGLATMLCIFLYRPDGPWDYVALLVYPLYFVIVVPVSWVLAVGALGYRDGSSHDWLTVIFAATTLGFWPMLAAVVAIVWLTPDMRFLSATSLPQILGPTWYLWGVPSALAIGCITIGSWPAIRRLTWLQVASLTSVTLAAFPLCVVSIVAIRNPPQLCVLGPLTATLLWTTFSWMRGRPFRAARPLGIAVGAGLATTVVFITALWDWHAPSPPWSAFHLSQLGAPFLLLALALFFVPEPPRPRRRKRALAALVGAGRDGARHL